MMHMIKRLTFDFIQKHLYKKIKIDYNTANQMFPLGNFIFLRQLVYFIKL